MRLCRVLKLCAAVACLATAPRALAIQGWETTAGDVLTGAIPLGSYWYTFHADDPEGRRQFYWCVGSNEVVNSALRLAFNETYLGERPNGNRYAFPSGHVGFITSGAAFLTRRYGWRFGLPAYAASAYVAYVRVETRHHRWRDVIAAAALSQGVAEFTVSQRQGPDLIPVIEPGYVGIEWTHTFEVR